MNDITKRTIDEYKYYLIEEEKCSVTIEKYIRDITAFINWTENKELTKTLVLEYKSMLTQQYAPASVNSVLSSLNGYFNYIERYDLKVKNLKVQRKIFCQSEKELTKAEYERLLKAAKSKKNERLYLIMQTICATGIRVSELKYVDVNSVMTGQAQVRLKGKIRMIILPRELCQLLKKYIKEKHMQAQGNDEVLTNLRKPITFETGKLLYGNANPKSPDFNSLADFISNGDYIEIKLPWQLLNFADPSRMMIHDDYYDGNYGIEHIGIDEIYAGIGDGNTRITLEKATLKGWGNKVAYHERLKSSYYIMQDLWKEGD